MFTYDSKKGYKLAHDKLSATSRTLGEECPPCSRENQISDKVAFSNNPVRQSCCVQSEEKLSESIPCMQAYRLLSQFVTVLKSQIEVARKSLLQAAFKAPIHGVLYCIREVVCDLKLR